MTIQIKNFDTSKASKSLAATFSIYIPEWKLTIHQCKYFSSDKGRFILFPDKPTKNEDGTYGKGVPYLEFDTNEIKERFQKTVLEEIAKIQVSPMEELANIRKAQADLYEEKVPF